MHNLTPDRDKFRKYFADLCRVCEVEDTVIEWFGKEHYESICTESLKQHIKRQLDGFMRQLQHQFKIEHVEVGGIDFSVWKLFLRVLDKPIISNSPVTYADLSTRIKIVMNGGLCNEVKRDGIMIDRDQMVELRPRD